VVVDLAGATTRLPEPVAEISPEVMGEEATAEEDSALVAEDSLEAEVVEEADSVACLVVAMAAVVAMVLAVVAMEATEEAKEVEEATEVDSVLAAVKAAAAREQPSSSNPLQSNLSIILHHRGLFRCHRPMPRCKSQQTYWRHLRWSPRRENQPRWCSSLPLLFFRVTTVFFVSSR
jgi:hypothetical protein